MSRNLRLLPWTAPGGGPAYLDPSNGNSHLSRVADGIEAIQLRGAGEVLHHARHLIAESHDTRELRWALLRTCEALSDVLRVADSRGARLAVADLPGVVPGEGRK